jgi:hypothetical protein
MWLPTSRRRNGSLVVEPVDPFHGAEFDVGEATPGPSGLDQLGLAEADLGFGRDAVKSRCRSPGQPAIHSATADRFGGGQQRHHRRRHPFTDVGTRA